MLPEVIIIGPSHLNALGVIRSLGEEGVKLFFLQVGKNSNFARYSRYLQNSSVVRNTEEIVPYLLQYFTEGYKKPLLIPTSDSCSASLDKAYEQLSEKFILPHADKPGDIEIMMDKLWQHERAKKCALGTPQTWFVEKNKPINRNIKYPCITKSICSLYGGKKNTYICFNKMELKGVIEKVTDPILVQEIIDKSNELALLGFVSPNGTLFIKSGFCYLNLKKDSYGTSSLHLSIEEIEDRFPINRESISEFIKSTGYKNGLFSFEFVIDKQNRAYFTEMNFRNDAYTYGATLAGCNIHFLLYKSIRGEIPYLDMQITNKKILSDATDFNDKVLKQRISLFKWLRFFKSHDGWLLYNKRDKSPFYFFLWEQIFLRVKNKKVII